MGFVPFTFQEERADQLQEGTKQFHSNAVRIKRKHFWENMKMKVGQVIDDKEQSPRMSSFLPLYFRSSSVLLLPSSSLLYSHGYSANSRRRSMERRGKCDRTT